MQLCTVGNFGQYSCCLAGANMFCPITIVPITSCWAAENYIQPQQAQNQTPLRGKLPFGTKTATCVSSVSLISYTRWEWQCCLSIVWCIRQWWKRKPCTYLWDATGFDNAAVAENLGVRMGWIVTMLSSLTNTFDWHCIMLPSSVYFSVRPEETVCLKPMNRMRPQ